MNDNTRPPVRPVSDTTNHDASSVTGLIKQLANDITSLFTKELALAKVEVSNSINEAKAGAVSMISGGSVLYAGFIVLLAAAVLGLSEVIEPWLAALIVGGIVAIIGLVMVKSGQKKLQPSAFRPEHTIDSLQKDKRAVKGATT